MRHRRKQDQDRVGKVGSRSVPLFPLSLALAFLLSVLVLVLVGSLCLSLSSFAQVRCVQLDQSVTTPGRVGRLCFLCTNVFPVGGAVVEVGGVNVVVLVVVFVCPPPLIRVVSFFFEKTRSSRPLPEHSDSSGMNTQNRSFENAVLWPSFGRSQNSSPPSVSVSSTGKKSTVTPVRTKPCMYPGFGNETKKTWTLGRAVDSHNAPGYGQGTIFQCPLLLFGRTQGKMGIKKDVHVFVLVVPSRQTAR